MTELSATARHFDADLTDKGEAQVGRTLVHPLCIPYAYPLCIPYACPLCMSLVPAK